MRNYPEIKTAVILAGGKGRRMINFSVLPGELKKQGFNPEEMHKSMIPIGGKPLLEHTILWLKKWGIKKVVIGVGYQKESIVNYFRDGGKWDIEIIYGKHIPGKTGDALKQIIDSSGIKEDYFFTVNSDQLTSFPLEELVKVHFKDKEKNNVATIGLVYPTFPFGKVEWDTSTHRITDFKEKPVLKIPTSGGIYLFSKEIENYLKGDLEKYTFPLLIEEGKIKGYLYGGYWDTINTIKDWERINNQI